MSDRRDVLEILNRGGDLCLKYGEYFDADSAKRVLEGVSELLDGASEDSVLICGGQGVNLPGIMRQYFGWERLDPFSAFDFPIVFTYGPVLRETALGEGARPLPGGADLSSGEVRRLEVALPDARLRGKRIVFSMLTLDTVRNTYFDLATKCGRCVLCIDAVTTVRDYDRALCQLMIAQQDTASKLCLLIDNRAGNAVPGFIVRSVGLLIGTNAHDITHFVLTGDEKEDARTLGELLATSSDAQDLEDQVTSSLRKAVQNLKTGSIAKKAALRAEQDGIRQSLATHEEQMKQFRAGLDIASFRARFLFDPGIADEMNKDISAFFVIFQNQILSEMDSLPTNESVCIYYPYFFSDTIKKFLVNEMQQLVRPGLQKSIEELKTYIVKSYRDAFRTDEMPEDLRKLLYTEKDTLQINAVNSADQYLGGAFFVPLGSILEMILLFVPGNELLEFVLHLTGAFDKLDAAITRLVNRMMPRKVFDKKLFEETVKKLDEVIVSLQRDFQSTAFPMIQDEVIGIFEDFVKSVDTVLDRDSEGDRTRLDQATAAINRLKDLDEEADILLQDVAGFRQQRP